MQKENGNVTEGLSGKIERTFGTIIRRVLILVCVESILIAGVLAVLYALSQNQNELDKYTAGIDKTMQSKVSMLEAIATGINSGTMTNTDDILAYVDEMVLLDDQVSAVYSCYDENITVMSGGWQPPEDFIVTEREWYKKAQENLYYPVKGNLSGRRGCRRRGNGYVYG